MADFVLCFLEGGGGGREAKRERIPHRPRQTQRFCLDSSISCSCLTHASWETDGGAHTRTHELCIMLKLTKQQNAMKRSSSSLYGRVSLCSFRCVQTTLSMNTSRRGRDLQLWVWPSVMLMSSALQWLIYIGKTGERLRQNCRQIYDERGRNHCHQSVNGIWFKEDPCLGHQGYIFNVPLVKHIPYCYYYLRVLYFANFCDSQKIAKLSTRKNFHQPIRHSGVCTCTITNCMMFSTLEHA